MSPKKLLLAGVFGLASFHSFADFKTANKYLADGQDAAAFAEFQKLARFGHVDAQMQLAKMFQDGIGTEVDLNSAVAWYLIAQDFGNEEAKDHYRSLRRKVSSRREAKNHYLATSEEYGFDHHMRNFKPIIKNSNFYPQRAKIIDRVEPELPEDERNARTAWTTVSYSVNENGYVEDVRVLASFPKGVLDEYVLSAVKQWRFEPKKRRNGEPERVENLSYTFKTKASSAKKHRKYEKQLRKYTEQLKALAEEGNSYAQARYALMLEEGIIDATKSKEHIEWYYRAAINGNGDAQLRLVHCLDNGEGCQPNEAKAFAWLVKAAKEGNERAQYQYARSLLNFENVHYNVAEAVEMLKQATHNQYLPAMVEYAKLLAFSTEEGVQNLEEAVKYAELARSEDPQNPVLLSVLGAAYSELGRMEEGEQLLRQAYDEAKKRDWPTDSYLQLVEGLGTEMMASEPNASY